MSSLARRPRIRRAVSGTARWALGLVGEPEPEPEPANPAPEPEPEPAPPPEEPAPDLSREVLPCGPSAEHESISDLLYHRLGEQDVLEVQERILAEEGPRQLYEGTEGEKLRRFLILAFGVWFELPGVLEKTGLTAAQPPEEIHAMARGPLAAAGGLYEADMVADALAHAGIAMADVACGLDFGCSSGRVLRVLRAAYPGASWRGCDPNAPAIEWAREHLAGVEFFVSGNAPPLALEDGTLDVVCAISIWSHFEPALGLRWFDEMHRVLRPGGHLVCTTHGLSTIAHDATRELRPPAQLLDIARSVYRRNQWYGAEFGEEGDWGVVNPDWGTAFLSPEWMLAQLCPRWRVLEFEAGRNHGNQDVYVLERA